MIANPEHLGVLPGPPAERPRQSVARQLIGHVGVAVVAMVALASLVSAVYPLIVWGLSQALFRDKANGSLIVQNGQIRGSYLLGQSFKGDQYFHPRPSAAGAGYAADASGGTNLGPTSAKLIEGLPDDPATKDVDESFAGIRQLAEQYRQSNGLAADVPVPADAVTRSASGLDPHISLANAQLQAARVAKARGKTVDEVRRFIRDNTQGRDLRFLGEQGVNVVRLNLALDGQSVSH